MNPQRNALKAARISRLPRVIATAKEIAMYDDNLAPRLNPGLLHFTADFTHRKARNFADTSDLSEKQ